MIEYQYRGLSHAQMVFRSNNAHDIDTDNLKCKVDKLNKDCSVLTKNNDQLHVLSNGLRDVLKKYVTKEKKCC
jgi:hypothetical protein